MWKTAPKEMDAYFADLEESAGFNTEDTAFSEALEIEMSDYSCETRYDFYRDIRNGVYKK